MKVRPELYGYVERMRTNPTKHEQIIYDKLKNAGIYFQFQYIVGYYIADFMLPAKKIIVEVDGFQHESNKEYDTRRDNYLRSRGYTVIRIKNKDVHKFDVSLLHPIYSTPNPVCKPRNRPLIDHEKMKMLKLKALKRQAKANLNSKYKISMKPVV